MQTEMKERVINLSAALLDVASELVSFADKMADLSSQARQAGETGDEKLHLDGQKKLERFRKEFQHFSRQNQVYLKPACPKPIYRPRTEDKEDLRQRKRGAEEAPRFQKIPKKKITKRNK